MNEKKQPSNRQLKVGQQIRFLVSNFFIKEDFIFENFLSNFFIIINSTLRSLRLSIFCCKLDILKLFRFLLKNIFGIGSKVKTPIFDEYLFLYFLANENNF